MADETELEGEELEGEPELDSGAEQETAEQPQTVIRDYLRSKGWDDIPDDETDDNLLEGITNLYQRLQSAPSEEELTAYRQSLPAFQEFSVRKGEFDEFLKSRTAPKEEPKNEAKPSTKWDPTWEFVTERDPATGMWKSKGAYGHEAAMARNKYEREAADRARRLTEDPLAELRAAGLDDYLKKTREELKKELAAEFKAEQAKEVAVNSVRSFWQDNASQLYVIDPITKAPVIGLDGQPRLSEAGTAYYMAREEAANFGITDPAKIHEFAKRSVNLAPKSSTEKRAEKQKKFLDRPEARGNRGNTIRNAASRGEAQTPNTNFLNLLRQTEQEMVQ